MIGASLLLLLLIVYLFIIVRHLVNKSYDVFGAVELPENAIAKFDFERYQRVITKVLPTSTLNLPERTAAAATSSIDR